MEKQDIRRYTSEQLREMREKGDFVPTSPSAPEFDLDDAFWEAAERAILAEREQDSVVLRLTAATIDRFREAGPDYLERMAHILEEYARKAS